MAGELATPPGSSDPHDHHDSGAASDPTRLRISDAERHQVAELLREAAGEGRLDLDELDQRLGAAYAARTYADLVPITHDLPGAPTLARPAAPSVPSAPPVPYGGTPVSRSTSPQGALVVPGPEREQHLAIMGGLDRKGAWVVPKELNVFAMMGGADLDLRQARFAAQEVTITINCLMGGAQIKVGPNVHVVMGGTGIMGAFQGPRGEAYEATADSPVVHVKGVAIMGGVEVKRD